MKCLKMFEIIQGVQIYTVELKELYVVQTKKSSTFVNVND